MRHSKLSWPGTRFISAIGAGLLLAACGSASDSSLDSATLAGGGGDPPPEGAESSCEGKDVFVWCGRDLEDPTLDQDGLYQFCEGTPPTLLVACDATCGCEGNPSATLDECADLEDGTYCGAFLRSDHSNSVLDANTVYTCEGGQLSQTVQPVPCGEAGCNTLTNECNSATTPPPTTTPNPGCGASGLSPDESAAYTAGSGVTLKWCDAPTATSYEFDIYYRMSNAENCPASFSYPYHDNPDGYCWYYSYGSSDASKTFYPVKSTSYQWRVRVLDGDWSDFATFVVE